MSKHRRAQWFFMAIIAFASAALSAADAEWPEITEDGLHRVHGSELAIVYAEPGADLAPYRRIKLLDAYVAFRKNWERDQRSRSADPLALSSRDIEKIKNELSGEFRNVFTEVLQQGGYPVVEEAAEDVLLLRPAIVNLDVTAPDTQRAGRGRTYADSAGEMTLYVELYDSVTGDLIAKAMDRQADRDNQAFYTWTTSATNRAAAERILRGWAGILLTALKQAHPTPQEGEG